MNNLIIDQSKINVSKMSVITNEIMIAVMAIIIPTIPAIVIVSLIVGVDFFFGIWRTIIVDFRNRRLIKSGKIKEEDIEENLISSQLGRTASKLFGFIALCLLAGALEFSLKSVYEIPFLVATILYISFHELKSIDENFKSIFGWGFYTGFLKLLNREPLIISKGSDKINFPEDDKK